MALGFQFAEFDQFFLCRLCCQENYKHGLNLNTLDGIGKPLTDLINQHVPFKVKYDPRLPANVCAGCLLQIQAIIEFRSALDTGQKKIQELFPIQDELDSNGLPKRKRGRPRKPPPSDNPPESPQKPENVPKPEENEMEIGKRKRKAPVIYEGAVLGKELDKALEEEGIVDEDVKPFSINFMKVSNKETVQQANFKCEVCHQDFKQENEFLNHQSSHKVLFNCTTCRESFSSFQTLDAHQEETSHTGNDLKFIAQKCICGENFNSYDDLQEHIQQQHPKVFKCSTCPKTFRFTVGLQAHKCTHSESGQFPCDVCGLVLKHPNSLTYHKRTKHGPLDKTFECLKCDKTFKHRLLLLRHQLVHSTDRPFKCDLCSASFKTKPALNAHAVVHTKVKNFQCHICDQTFSHLSSLKLHLRCHTGKKPFQCDYCQKSFYQKGNLKEHYRTHTQEKPYLCTICDRGFKTSSQLKSHTKIHLGDKPFECEHCHKAFPYKFSLKNHLKRHEGGRPFMCDICSKEFRDRWSLKKHLRFHTGEKPYRCPFCDKAFSDCSNMIKHKMLHLKHVNVQRPAEEENPNFDIWNVLPEDELSKDKNVLSQILLIYPDDENQELADQFSLKKDDDIQNKELEDGAQMNTMMQVTDEHGNPLSFTTQEGTTLQLTTDGESLQLTTSDGSTIPVQISTTENDNVLQSMILPSMENETDEVDQNVEALEFVTDHQDVQLLAGLTESSLDFLPLT